MMSRAVMRTLAALIIDKGGIFHHELYKPILYSL